MESPNNHRRSSSANDALSPTSHRRIPFVHRLSSFRRNHHSRTSSNNSSHISSSVSDTTNTKPKDDMLSSDLILKVAIVRGRSLAREDEANIPNPYVNVRCGGIRQRTDTIKKSSDPEWLCTFEFNLSNDIIGHKKRLRALKNHGLSVTVYSKDRFSSIFLGQVSWSFDQLFQNQSIAFDENTAKWFPLSQTSQRKRFHLRKRKEDVDTSATTATSDTDQAEICIQYGLVYQSEQGITIPTTTTTMEEDWQYLLNHKQQDLITDSASIISTSPVQQQPSPVMMQESTSSSTFSSRFKRNPSQQKLKKDNSINRNRNRTRNRNRKSTAYAKFQSDIMGITFLEIESAKDLPPERNMTRTGFDMDPFVIVTYGTSTFRTRAIRHNLNPTWNEKLFFHVRNSQENYKIKFAVYDKDKFSNNDFVASQELTISDIIQKMPSPPSSPVPIIDTEEESPSDEIDRCMGRHTMSLKLANAEKWQHSIHPTLTIRAKFVPYVEIRKMFWVALAKTCDGDNSNTMSRIEVQTMLETLGSNISESTLTQFWTDHGKDLSQDLTMEELVESLENCMQHADESQMHSKQNPTVNPFFMASDDDDENDEDDDEEGYDEEDESDQDDEDDEEEEDYFTSLGEYDDDDDDDDDLLHSNSTTTNPHSPDEADYEALAEADGVQYINGPLKDLELKDDDDKHKRPSKSAHEKVIRLTECPICHKPNLGKRGQMDIVTHVATCAANDWTTVDRFLMGNFGTEAQAQRKWFVKLVNKVGYGRYSAGKNNANIIVQDRATGQLIDERMSVYIRLGMRLVYKGMSSGIQSKTAKKILANMSRKQGRRFDNPLSVKEIPSFIKFHQLDMTQVLEPTENFKTFNEFFYRKLKPGSRPCDSPDNKNVAVSPADCRMMAFPTIDSATNIWIKGTEFSIAKLLDDPVEAEAFEGGALAIFRLAPQDYHRYNSPVDGLIRKIHSVEGQYYTVNPMAIRTTLDVYGDNKRDIVHMDTEVFGKVSIVCIGAMMVGSIVLTAGVGDHLARTDELGYFAFGGSTLVVLFEKNAILFDDDLIENGTNSLETLVRVGNHIGIHP
ncbi:phosphatidylserine decarboxylase-domain-containing protein [Helicostylum pulchrum]|nr:phosphatidylserine decarboxylase-domain-containing protein [Helicostylum pulchrum]